ncbi:MAG: glycerol-3-phosphate O-acyltransferase/dihydroxyacetone phosphate acyltransferase, partial [Paracoccaceae bacterium]
TASWDLLAAGGVLALFPEGISHNDPFIKPMKSGTARIVLEAERQRGPLNISIVPIGLNFEAKSKFRSRILMQIGDPLEIGDIVENYTQAGQLGRIKCVQQLSQRIHDALVAVSPNFETWEEARLVGRTADIWGRQDHGQPETGDFIAAIERRRMFAEGYHWLHKNHPERTTAFRKTLTEYEQLLSTAGLRDQQVGATYPVFSALRFVLHSTLVLAIQLPLSAIGTILNLIPFQISALIGRPNDPDKRATWSIFSSVLVFPVIWTLQAVIASALSAHWFGPPWGWITGIGVLLASPLTGRLSLTFHDLRYRLTHEFRAWVVLRTRKNLAEKLVKARSDLMAELTELVDFYDDKVGATD